MIEVKKLSDQIVILNSDLIETIEATPDTMIVLTNGRKIVVKDSVDEVLKKVIEYRRSIHEGIGIKPE
jgi:flagellar protein FlbD